MNCNNNKAGKNLFQEKKVEIVSHKKNIIETTSRIDYNFYTELLLYYHKSKQLIDMFDIIDFFPFTYS